MPNATRKMGSQGLPSLPGQQALIDPAGKLARTSAAEQTPVVPLQASEPVPFKPIFVLRKPSPVQTEAQAVQTKPSQVQAKLLNFEPVPLRDPNVHAVFDKHSGMLLLKEFQVIQDLSGRAFSMDAFCYTGSNARCPQFCSPDQALAFDYSGHHTWFQPPFSNQAHITKLLQHYTNCKLKSPADTSACFLLPDWQKAAWQPYLKDMEVLHQYPPGYHLFSKPRPTEGHPNKRARLPGIKFPVKVYHDPPRQVSALATASTCERPTMLIDGTVAGISASVLLDSGAAGRAFVSSDFCHQHNIRYHQSGAPNAGVLLADGSSAGILGECKLSFKIGAYQGSVTAQVLHMVSQFQLILGDQWLVQHNAKVSFGTSHITVMKGNRRVTVSQAKKPVQTQVTTKCDGAVDYPTVSAIQFKRLRKKGAQVFLAVVNQASESSEINAPPGAQAQIQALVSKHAKCFADELPGAPAPDSNAQRAILQEPDSRPTYRGLFRYSQAEMREIEERIKYLLAKGLIQPSSSPYGAPVLFAKKKDGGLRMCIDYRLLNKQTVRNSYTLPRIDDLLDRLQGAQYFTSLDMMDAYYQIPLHPDDIPSTAFNTPIGHYEFRVLSFGLANAPAIFQAEMNKLFADCRKFVMVYLDDICIFSRTQEEHLKHLDTVLGIIAKAGKYLKLKKCRFMHQDLAYLGHIVDAHGVHPDPSKVKAVQDWPRPRNVKDVRQFLGLANYFRRFIHKYANIASPLYRLTQNDAKWQWRDEVEQQAFTELKQALVSAPVLALPDFTKPFEVIVDASNFAIGGVLLQDGRPVAFESCKLSSAEMNYTTTEREMLAVVHCCKIWRCYLEGAVGELTVHTDHVSNTYFSTQTMLSQRQARWSEFLSRFKINIKYKPGAQNVADPLSRHPQFLVSAIAVAQTRKKLSEIGDNTISGKFKFKPFLDRVQVAIKHDPWFNDQTNIQTHHLQLFRGVYYKGRQLVVPDHDNLRLEVMQLMHDDPYSGHPGRDRTIHAIRQSFWWPNWQQDVDSYIQQCHSCQLNKSSNQKPSGKLMPIDLPHGAWETVSMDFVTDLPDTPGGHNAIMVVVDYLTKMTRLIPIKKIFTAEDVAGQFVDRIFSMHGVPLKLITDRDTRFTSAFWREFGKRVSMHPAMSTAFHPQTDGNTERVNRLMQDILRHYVGPDHTDWDKYLGLVEFAINAGYHDSIKSTPFTLNYGRNPRTPVDVMLHLRHPDRMEPYKALPDVNRFIQHMQDKLEHAKLCLQAAQARQKAYADKKRNPDPEFKPGDTVALNTANLQFKHGCRKLLPKFIGPFEVLEAINPVAYRLKLPDTMKIHNVFHTSLLKSYKPDPNHKIMPPPLLVDGVEEYEVQAILKHADRKAGKQLKREYLVRWKGYGHDYDSWEPPSHLRNAQAILDQYLKDNNLLPKSQRAPKSKPKPETPAARVQPARGRRARQTMAACLCPCFTRFPSPPLQDGQVPSAACCAMAEPA